AIGGDSAGANLALSAITSSAPQSRAAVRAALLFYGAFDLAATAERNRAHAGLQMQLKTYVAGNTALFDDPRVSPLEAVTAKLPPCFIMGAGDDTARLHADEHARRVARGHAFAVGVPGAQRVTRCPTSGHAPSAQSRG